MYNIKLESYVPAPQPATADRIVAAHYYAAWKKGAPGLHEGFDDLHDYPERTPLMGYYDEENPAVCDWEIKWAVEHGVNCFIHCWYRKKENEGKPVTLDALRCGHGLHEALFHAKYQQMIKFAIMFENNPRWGNTDAKDLVEHLMPFWTEQYFRRENYLKIDKKPVLFVCNPKRLAEAFASPQEQRAAWDACRDYAKACGFDGLIIAACLWNSTADAEVYRDCQARGYDFHFGYNSGYNPAEHFPSDEEIIAGQCDLLAERYAVDPLCTIPTATCFRDCTPRTTQRWFDLGYSSFRQETIYHLSPDGFRKVLRRMKELSDALPEGAWGKRILMIDNWNEWDEGHYVSPSHEYGFRYLQAIREELTARDNLPDYRTPQDMGFTDLNRSWAVPDMGPLCEERLKAKK